MRVNEFSVVVVVVVVDASVVLMVLGDDDDDEVLEMRLLKKVATLEAKLELSRDEDDVKSAAVGEELNRVSAPPAAAAVAALATVEYKFW